MTREGDLQKAVFDYSTARGIFIVRFYVGPVITEVRGRKIFRPNPIAGFPDIGGVLQRRERGRAWYVELKTMSRHSKVKAHQADWLSKLAHAGARVAVCRTIDEYVATMIDWGEII